MFEGWLIQVTKGNPAEGEQDVALYASWEPKEDAAVLLVIKTFNLAEEDIASMVIDLPKEVMEKLGLKPGEAGPLQRRRGGRLIEAAAVASGPRPAIASCWSRCGPLTVFQVSSRGRCRNGGRSSRSIKRLDP